MVILHLTLRTASTHVSTPLSLHIVYICVCVDYDFAHSRSVDSKYCRSVFNNLHLTVRIIKIALHYAQ